MWGTLIEITLYKPRPPWLIKIPNQSHIQLSRHIALLMELSRKAVEMEKTNKWKAEQAIAPEAKKARPAPPVHGQRLFFEAKLYWVNQYGRKRSEKVKLLLDNGCTGPLLSRDFV